MVTKGPNPTMKNMPEKVGRSWGSFLDPQIFEENTHKQKTAVEVSQCYVIDFSLFFSRILELPNFFIKNGHHSMKTGPGNPSLDSPIRGF